MRPFIAPSLLSADFARLGEAAKLAEEAGADLIHVDIMDGHFVPSLSFGPQLIASLKKILKIPVWAHLMVEKPDNFIFQFYEAGTDWLSIHLEASQHIHREIIQIKELKIKAGLALNPGTPIHFMIDILKDLDFVLLMTVDPGWGGQTLIESTRNKIRLLKNWIKGQNLEIPVAIDGGVTVDNMADLIKDGVDIFVAGATIFGHEDPAAVIRQMKEIALGGGTL
ncbi:MAG: ribulose-phosphate 3-epimerase [Candidatus Aminicenantes bacterium]|nr:ribulose-phosphate 3-epimerase [Candidatus Aminicenantes bacterium]